VFDVGSVGGRREGGKRAWGRGNGNGGKGERGKWDNEAMGGKGGGGGDLFHYYAYFVFHLLEYGVVHAGSFFVCYFCFFDPSTQEYAPTGSIEAEMRNEEAMKEKVIRTKE
jgi:hypothetical protein